MVVGVGCSVIGDKEWTGSGGGVEKRWTLVEAGGSETGSGDKRAKLEAI